VKVSAVGKSHLLVALIEDDPRANGIVLEHDVAVAGVRSGPV
jgi:hypothetical protein